MLINWADLSADALLGIAQSIVLREGTDYGAEEVSFDEKVDEVISAIKRGDAVLVYSELEETVDVLPHEEFMRQQHDNRE